MKNFILKLTSAAVALSIPLSASAYSIHHFSSFKRSASTSVVDVPVEQDTISAEDQYQLWDTKCRDELGIPGGDVLGALRFNLNRCINTKQRQVNLSKRQRRGARRAVKRTQAQVNASVDNRKSSENQVNRSIVNKQRIRRRFTSGIPKTQREKARQFQSFRSNERAQIRKKERYRVVSARAKRAAMIKARKACVKKISLERAVCIKEKKEEFLKAE
ncbi:MAG: hypothetical protein QF755_05340 [Candidatus Peribacteraceae bacterium]|jgi:hypothetical protein|nr:hypothetical protein [Candidatus Peribacteraceae bacterium]HCI03760.1 hypothetical protein [Candidatus Peribacteria bacterium]|tara:strand:+ start:2360 stop:3010 length:651 start_codon:yes stop_codon:yes gene_type:complete